MATINLIVGSPVDYNEIVVYISIDDEVIALVQKEEGIDKIKIEIFGRKNDVQVYVDDFIKALNLAKEELRK